MSTVTAYPSVIVSTGDWTGFTAANLSSTGGDWGCYTTASLYTSGVCRGFDFSTIPAGATINSVKIEYSFCSGYSGQQVTARGCRASLDGGGSWSAYTTGRSTSTDTFTAVSDAVTISPSVSQLQDTTNFRIVFSGKTDSLIAAIALDYLRVVVDYTGTVVPEWRLQILEI